MQIKNRIVVVTGAASGIGRALARRFATEGAKLVVCSDINGEGAAATAKEIGGIAFTTNVGKEADIKHLIETVETEHGPIDLFCSNAGIGIGGGSEVSDDRWQRIWDINVMAHVWAARHLVPRMIARGGGYLFSTASAAWRRMASGPGSSGNPWPRLMALLSRASCDIASKMVTGRSAKTLFMEVMEQSAASLGRQARGFPRQHAAGEVLVVGEAVSLRGQRRGHRPLAGSAGENHLFALGVRDILRIKTGKRDDDGIRIGFDGDFIRLADIDQEIAPFGNSLRHLCRRQIVNAMTLTHHQTSRSPNHSVFRRLLLVRRQTRLSRGENQAPEKVLINAF